MNQDYKIGDRVIFDNFGKDEKGVIQRINLDDIERIEMQVKRFPDRGFLGFFLMMVKVVEVIYVIEPSCD